MLKLTKDATIQKLSAIEYNREILEYAKKKYKPLRQASKRVTFALQYGGTESTLEKKSGFSKAEAESIVTNYKKLYHVSEEEKAKHIQQATIDGYVTGAFGLRIRTPILQKTMYNNKGMSNEAEAEKRTASNARFQSYGLLNTRSGIAFNNSVRYNLDKKIKLGIRPIGQIHDAQYFMIKDDPDVFLYCNEGLVKEDSWQKLDEIKHPDVHLGGELSIFYPSWGEELVVPNHISKEDLLKLVDDYLKTL